MSDLISRQAAISAICNACGKIDCDKMDKCEKLQLPPANCSEFPNNSDVVDRQKAKNAICNACGKIDCDEMDTCEKLDIPSEGSKLLQPWEVLVAQAVLPQPEIVRCKDCKHWIPYDWMFSEMWQSKNIADYPEDDIGCNYCDMAMKANDFCSRAERRTE